MMFRAEMQPAVPHMTHKESLTCFI